MSMSQINEQVTGAENEVTEAVTGEAHESTGASESVAASLGLKPQLFVFQLLNFALVLGIVWFLILKPLTKKLDERKKIIDESLDRAKEIETNFIMSQQKFDEKLSEAKVEASAIIQKAHDESEKMGEDMKQKAKEEIALLIEKAKKTIASEKQEMKEELRRETVELVILATEKLLGQKFDAKKDEKFIEEILDSVK